MRVSAKSLYIPRALLRWCALCALLLFTTCLRDTLSAQATPTKPRVTLDEFFNSVAYTDVALAPDGKALLIGTERADWRRDSYRKDIWLWRDGSAGPVLLTSSGRDWGAQWSPDGNWVAFLSDRPAEATPPAEQEEPVPNEIKPAPLPPSPPRPRDDDEEEKPEPKKIAQIYLLSAHGGEAFPVTQGLEEVHAFAWSPDSQFLYFATRVPWSKARRDAYRKEWNDVVRYRESERGDVIARLRLSDALLRLAATAAPRGRPAARPKGETAETPAALPVAQSRFRVRQLTASPDGRWLAFNTDSISQREEGVDAYEIYLAPANGGEPSRLTHNQAIESDLRWAPDSRAIFFTVESGSVEGKYEDVQPRVYAVDVPGGAVHRWARNFNGALTSWSVLPNGSLVAAGRLGTEVPIYTEANAAAALLATSSWRGTYANITTALHSPRLAFVYSAVDKPTEVYVADSARDISNAVAVTSLNKLFTQRALPQGRAYTWKADDRTELEGMLLYPPGQFGAKHLPMFMLIHGGPGDADGNMFGANWYDWAELAASEGYLVFRPNYRGSTGYGDDFMRQIAPHLVSRPGKDILEGVDALVRDGIADPERLTIGGYSYGGYMTNWLLTQTTRFQAAVTGAGAIEHAANWGNDDLTFDDAWFLGGAPWQAEKTYNDEAALWQIDKVKTPTHIVAGADDIRVAVAEDYLLERALHTLGVPSSLLIFPGEGHSLSKNPWHGKIKVREELKWLAKYGGSGAVTQADRAAEH